MDMHAVYDYIEAHQREALDELRAFCAQPSVSADGRGLAEMAALCVAALERRGFQVELVPQEGGYPIVYAESTDATPDTAPTLLIYNHYDVQPEGDPDLWTCPPFDLTIRDGKILARGVADTKGNIVSRLAAIDALRAVRGTLPIKIKWIIEGEEETGSGSLDQFLLEYRDRLAADGCLWEFGSFHWDGTPQIMLGMKGMVTVELSVEGPNRDLHSSMAAYVASPTWRLIWALATLKDENEYVLIDGFYDDMRPPTATDLALVKALPDDTATRLESLGLEQFAVGLRDYHLRVSECFSPTCNVEGLWSGYTGPGSKTILPREARAKLDFRLVPDQNPDEIIKRLREHLDEKGFGDVVISQLDANLYPARVDPASPFVVLAMTVAAELSGRRPYVYPSSPASGPMYSFSQGLGLPVVAMGCGYPGSAAHAPDENIRVDDFREGTREMALLFQRMAGFDFAAAARLDAAFEARKKAAVVPGVAPELADPFSTLDTGLEPIDMDAIAAEMARESPEPADEPAPAKASKRRSRDK